MSRDVTADQLDTILALQLSIAWAGEAAGDPPRLGWWKSDLVDPEGGGDLFARLAPKTSTWAGLALARQVAIRVDDAARQNLARPDNVWTLFHFGFAIDEQLTDRLAWHRHHQHIAADALGPHFIVGPSWSQQALTDTLSRFTKPKVQITPSGRKLIIADSTPVEACLLLAAALLPLSPNYPLPFIEVKG